MRWGFGRLTLVRHSATLFPQSVFTKCGNWMFAVPLHNLIEIHIHFFFYFLFLKRLKIQSWLTRISGKRTNETNEIEWNTAKPACYNYHGGKYCGFGLTCHLQSSGLRKWLRTSRNIARNSPLFTFCLLLFAPFCMDPRAPYEHSST